MWPTWMRWGIGKAQMRQSAKREPRVRFPTVAGGRLVEEKDGGVGDLKGFVMKHTIYI